ncbi:hypothetical protein ECC02_011228 [Trypanosoma cruzi]|uniref:Uncharacterized protein n=1 Tax=Trypanosoma cruzi TaxID=5693 RepID=A0A7J6XNM3_TRYCR|nr:hypothetical protein ECC02_011228 [Trypanosoma cruzi]
MSFNRLTLCVSARRLYFMGSSACCCSPQPSHRRVSAARRAQSLFLCAWGLREARKNTTGVASLHRESERSKRKKKSGEKKCSQDRHRKDCRCVKCTRKAQKIYFKERQGVAVCVWRRGCLPALAAKKTKQEGKKCVLRPTGPRRTPTRHGSLSAPFVAAPPHACSGRGAQGRRHERVGGCASGAVGRETHGTPHRKSAEETIKRGKSRKKKKFHIDCPQKQKRGDGRWEIRKKHAQKSKKKTKT